MRSIESAEAGGSRRKNPAIAGEDRREHKDCDRDATESHSEVPSRRLGMSPPTIVLLRTTRRPGTPSRLLAGLEIYMP